MTGRALLFCVLASALAAQAQPVSRETKIALANALHAGDANGAIKVFDPKMPGYDHVRDDIRHALEAAEVSLRIDSETGVWDIYLTARDLASGVTHRQEKVSATEVDGLIKSLKPLNFFAPPQGREPWDVLFAFAASLENEDQPPSLDQFDRAMPGLDALKTAIRTLWTQWRIEPAVELRSNEGDDTHRTIEVDWALALVNRESASIASHRDGLVTCKLEKDTDIGKKAAVWRIVSFTPTSLF